LDTVLLLALVQLDPLISKLDLALAESPVHVCVDEKVDSQDHLVNCLRHDGLHELLLPFDLELHLDDSFHWNWCPVGGG